jgi:hypothetical protein
MRDRTQIVCLHEGQLGRSIDPVFINRVLKDLDPSWLRPWKSNVVRLIPCSARTGVIERMPHELKACLKMGSDTTLMVWADLDHDMPDGDALKNQFWRAAHEAGIERADFDQVVFVFPKDRLENWVEFLITGATNEDREGPRVTFKEASAAAQNLARMCKSNKLQNLPASLQWSCGNWRALVERMK